MAKAKYGGPAEALQRYEAIVEAAEVDRKGAANPYTSLNGWMTSFLDKDGSMSLRLSTEDRTEFIDTFNASIAHQYGKNMPEFAVVPKAVFDDDELIGAWFARSWEWVGTLKPKPTTKR